MKERLQQLLQDKKLSANKLAEMLGIQPSGISHILAGRNKPSIDFVTKLLLAFPDLNPDWFILGTGSMYRMQTAQPPSAPEAAESVTSQNHQPLHPVMPAANTANTTNTTVQTHATAQLDAPTTPVPHNSEQQASADHPSTSQGVLDFSVTDLPGNDPTSPSSPQPSTSPTSIYATQHQIRRVMIFYTDHTVESFDYTDR